MKGKESQINDKKGSEKIRSGGKENKNEILKNMDRRKGVKMGREGRKVKVWGKK